MKDQFDLVNKKPFIIAIMDSMEKQYAEAFMFWL